MRTGGVQPPVKPETSRFPRKELPHMPGSPTTPGWASARDIAPPMLPSVKIEHVGARDYQVFAARWLAYALPCQRFADILANVNA